LFYWLEAIAKVYRVRGVWIAQKSIGLSKFKDFFICGYRHSLRAPDFLALFFKAHFRI